MTIEARTYDYGQHDLRAYRGDTCDDRILQRLISESTRKCPDAPDCHVLDLTTSPQEEYLTLVGGSETYDFTLRFIERKPPANDLCVNAINLVIDADPIRLPKQAGVDSEIPYEYSKLRRGVWYRLIGQGKPIRLVVEPIGLPVRVFNGISCNDLNGGTQVTSSWVAEQGQTYYIHVSMYDGWDMDHLDRTIVAETGQPPPNDMCESATDIYADKERVIVGNIENATEPLMEDVLQCADRYTWRGDGIRGVWYKFQGTGKRLHFWFCHKETDFYPFVSIFRRTANGYPNDCQYIDCVKEDDLEPLGSTDPAKACDWNDLWSMSPFCFDSIEGEDYYLHVGGREQRQIDAYDHSVFENPNSFGMTFYESDEDCDGTAVYQYFFLELWLILLALGLYCDLFIY